MEFMNVGYKCRSVFKFSDLKQQKQLENLEFTNFFESKSSMNILK